MEKNGVETAQVYEQLITRFIIWAEQQPDVRAAFVVGSRARSICPADQWSDMDIVMISSDPGRYLLSDKWLWEIGEPQVTFLERTGSGDEIERRVLFTGGLDVDIPVTSVRQMRLLNLFLGLHHRFPSLLRLIPRARCQGIMAEISMLGDIVNRGIRVLLDKDGLLQNLPLTTTVYMPPSPPTGSDYLQNVNDFWYHAVWTAKKLRRGELWTAKSCCDRYMKNLLLGMLEWHTRAHHGWDFDTWHNGRFLEQWADPRAVKELETVFATYDEADVWRALVATMDLFRWVGQETAEKLNFAYPIPADEYVTNLVIELRDGRDG